MDEQARWGTCESVIEEIDRQCLTSLHLCASWFDIATDETVPGGQPEGRQDQSEPGDGDDHVRTRCSSHLSQRAFGGSAAQAGRG